MFSSTTKKDMATSYSRSAHLTAGVRVPGHDDHGFRRNVINRSSAS
jgi:hypothetical protein